MRRSWPDRFLFLEAMLRLATARLMLLILPFRTIAARLGRTRSESCAVDDAVLHRIHWSLLAASRRAPWRCECLEQSIAGEMMLRARHIPATLYLGVDKRDRALKAHAWIRSAGTLVTGGEGSGRYEVLWSWGADGNDGM